MRTLQSHRPIPMTLTDDDTMAFTIKNDDQNVLAIINKDTDEEAFT